MASLSRCALFPDSWKPSSSNLGRSTDIHPMKRRTVRSLASGRQICPSTWTAVSSRTLATREGASTEEKYGKETDDNMAPPKGAQHKEGYDLDKKADSQVFAATSAADHLPTSHKACSSCSSWGSQSTCPGNSLKEAIMQESIKLGTNYLLA